LSKIGTAHQASGLQIPQMLTLSWRGSLHKPSQNERKYNGHYDSYNQTIENLKIYFMNYPLTINENNIFISMTVTKRWLALVSRGK
jgi:hypothetical protein